MPKWTGDEVEDATKKKNLKEKSKRSKPKRRKTKKDKYKKSKPKRRKSKKICQI